VNDDRAGRADARRHLVLVAPATVIEAHLAGDMFDPNRIVFITSSTFALDVGALEIVPDQFGRLYAVTTNTTSASLIETLSACAPLLAMY